MATVTVQLLGGLAAARGCQRIQIALPEGSSVDDLRRELVALGFDATSPAIIVTLNDRGLRQWPSDRPIAEGDQVAVFPRITGGGRYHPAHRPHLHSVLRLSA